MHLLRQAAEHGAILFRGFPLATAEDFDRFVAAFDLPNFAYDESLSNAVRVNRTPRVFTANEAPPSVTIFLHHEMAQTPVYPSRLFFFCEQAAETGGATPICRSDVLWERLAQQSPALRPRLREPRACSTRTSCPPRTTPTPAWAELAEHAARRRPRRGRAAARRSVTPGNGSPTAASARRPRSCPPCATLADGRKSFFNQLIAAVPGWKDTRNDPSQVDHLRRRHAARPRRRQRGHATWRAAPFDIPWQTGDVALVDNFVDDARPADVHRDAASARVAGRGGGVISLAWRRPPAAPISEPGGFPVPAAV